MKEFFAEYRKGFIAGGSLLVVVLAQLGINVCDASGQVIAGQSVMVWANIIVGLLGTAGVVAIGNKPQEVK